MYLGIEGLKEKSRMLSLPGEFGEGIKESRSGVVKKSTQLSKIHELEDSRKAPAVIKAEH